MANTRVAVTNKTSANQVFSFGRDHGYYGRIMSQTVVALDTLAVRNGNEVVGFSFTPQDGNPLLSTVAAMLWYLDPETLDRASTSCGDTCSARSDGLEGPGLRRGGDPGGRAR